MTTTTLTSRQTSVHTFPKRQEKTREQLEARIHFLEGRVRLLASRAMEYLQRLEEYELDGDQ